MLIQKSKLEEGDIGTFKMVNGDEIVAKIVNKYDDGYTLSAPCAVMPGAKGVGLIQSLFTADPDQNVEVKFIHIMMQAPTVEEMKKHYIKITSGIQLV